jgi:hypothetical protein
MNTRQELPASAPPSVRAPMPRRPLWRRLLGSPSTPAGWWSVGLAIAFFVFLGLFYALVAAGQRGGDTFFSNPWLAWTILTAGSAAIAGGAAAGVGIVGKGERSLLVFVALLLGLFVLTFVIGEVVAPH